MGIKKKPLRIIPLEKRLMLDASLAGLITSLVIPENTANAGETIIDNDGDVTVSGTTTDFSSDSLTITTTGGLEDQLSVNNEGIGVGQIGVSGTDITYEGTIIGTISSNGINGADLQIDLNANASKISIERLIENITYRNTSDTPTVNRTINVSLGIYFSEDISLGIAPENDTLVSGNNTGITVADGATIGITSAELSVTDVDNTPSELVYTVTSNTIRGQIQLSGVATTSFTQADLDGGLITYVHDGSDSTFDRFEYTVTDGTDTLVATTFNISITQTDDAPTVTTNNATTISLGFTGTIGGTADNFGTQTGSYAPNTTFGTFQSQIDNLDSQLRFTFTTPATIPTDIPGQVLFESGGAGVGMTLALNSNNELALYAGSATSTPRLVSPISLETSTQYSVVVEVSDTDNQLRISYEQAANHDWFYEGRTAEAVLTGFTQTDFVGTDNGGYGLPNSTGSFGGFNGTSSGTGVFQGTLDSNLIITRAPTSTPTPNTDLVTFDSDTPPGQIVYTITDAVDDGVLRLNGVALGLGDTFTQVDLNKGLITYDSVTDPAGPDIDSFDFSVTDGNTVITDTYTININTVNTAPEIYDENIIFTDDFTGGGTGWNNNTTSTHAELGEYWGRFNRNIHVAGDQELTQTFALSGTQEFVTVEFDFFEIDTWDNEYFYVYVDDVRISTDRLRWNVYERPNDSTINGVYKSVTELSNDDAYTDVGRDVYRDQFYHYKLIIPTDDTSMKLSFGTSLNSTNLNDESFGLDNIQISEMVAGGTGTKSVSVTELIRNGEIATKVLALDSDVGQNLTYSLTGGTGVGVFNIDATTGDITVIDDTQIDFETMPTSYTLDVQVQDNGPGLLTDTQTITIDILDSWENTSPFVPYQVFSFAENDPNGTVIGTPTFTDPEGDGIERWQIIDGNEYGVFSINATTGQIELADNSTVNFEGDNRYDIRLRVWDDNFLGLYYDRTIRINVTDFDDAPTLSPEDVGENAAPGIFYSAATGNFYRFVDSNANYATAKANAEAALLNGANGHLLTVESAAEKAFVNSISDQHLWMGVSDAAAEGVWRYTSGPNEGLQFWQGAGANVGGSGVNGFFNDWRGTAEPNNGTAYNGAIFYRNDGRWVDVPVTNGYRYMIEWEGTDVVNNDTYYVNYDTPTDLNNGDNVGIIEGLDPEGDTLNYSIQGGTGAALFNLDPTTGQITIADASSLDPNIDYTLTVRATEDNGANQFVEETITIILNENLSLDLNNGHTASEGGTSVIDPITDLAVSDNDGVATDIIFDIDTFPANGQLELTTNPGVGIIEFTLDDLNNNRVQYVHDGSETLSDSFTFIVSDGGQTLPLETFNINVTPVNDAPIINVNTGTTIVEGATAGITNAMLSGSDIDNSNPALIYTASSYVRGQIEVSGAVQNTFTQDDVNNNRVVFRHNGDEGATASFDITLSDGSLTDTATFTLNVTPQNDSAVITTNTGFSMLEGGTHTITTAELNVTDPDDSGTGITYSLSNIVGGQVQLSTNPGVPILSFTDSDLSSNRVRFVHDGSEGDATFDIEVSDGLEHGAVVDNATVNITRIPVNDAPEITRNLGTSVNEGGLTQIKTIVFDSTDPDNIASELTYTITNEVNGQLELLSNLGVQITSFTQTQLNAGDIVFRHDGSSTLVASFDAQLSDGSLSSAVETFNMTVDNVNDPPVISTGPATTVIEGLSTPITTTQLDSLDPDNLPITLTYTVTSTTNGDVQLSGVNTTTFTQADLDNGLISFVHDGSETINASFDVTLSDGSLTDTATVNLNVTPVNDQTTLVVNDGEPNIIDFNDHTIDSHDPSQDNAGSVATVSADGSTLSISNNAWKKIDYPYTLTGNSVLSFEFRTDGLLEIQGIGFDTDTSIGSGIFGYQIHGYQIWSGADQGFRNYELGDGWVRYDIPIGADHTGVMNNLMFIADNDDGNAGTTEFRNVNFYEAGAVIDLNEGNTFNITSAHITAVDPDDSGTGLDYTVSDIRNGVVQVSGVTTTTFTQDDIDNNRVTFVHDGSETLTSGFDISLADGLENSTTADTGTFNLIINPVNDDTVINTNTTITLDENATSVISNTNLNITDVDDSPNDVIISVTSNPADGIITRASAPTTPITSFTLAELNAGVIRYTQQDAENAADSFDFTVTDGTYTSGTETFNFTINPINDNVINATNTGANITESGFVTITNTLLNTTDDDNTNVQIVYTITDTDSGWVELTTQSGFPITSFTQDDVNNNRVVFRHDGSTSTTADFDYSVVDPTGIATTGTFNVNVATPVNDAPVIAISNGAPNTIDFGTTVISPYAAGGAGDGQGGSQTDLEVSNDGTVLTIYGNAWKKIPLPQTITADTVLTFDFRSTREGEIHSIGFDNNDNITDSSTPSGAMFELFGTDSNGLFTQTYNTYNLGDGWTRFEIPVGDTFTGAVTDLFFGADDDAGADGISQFRDVTIYEASPIVTMAEGATTTLSNTNLNVFDTDTPATTLTYNVTAMTNGQIQLNGVNATIFTQDDIDNNRVTFIHDGSETTAADFNFTVTDGTSITAPKTFDIVVTPVNDSLTLTLNTGTSVNEASNVTITNLMLDTSDPDNAATDITYTASNISNGHIEVSGAITTTFTQDDIDNNRVVFVHDGSETTAAAFDISVVDLTGVASTATFNMTAVPTNDTPYALNINNDLVSERETIGFKIADLSTGDVDLPGDTFTYSIMSDPDGKFAIIGDELMLNNTLSFATSEFHTVTIRTNDNNGGTFDQAFTITVERVDNFVAPPSDPVFGSTDKGELDDRDLFNNEKRNPLIQNFVHGDGENAFYGKGNLGQIIRENTSFSIEAALNGQSPSQHSSIESLLVTNNDGSIENINPDASLQHASHYTKMIDFLKSTEDFSGDNPAQKINNDSDSNNISIVDIAEQFDNTLTYHQDRIAQLIQALKES